jgi:hypothetical protein
MDTLSVAIPAPAGPDDEEHPAAMRKAAAVTKNLAMPSLIAAHSPDFGNNDAAAGLYYPARGGITLPMSL